MVPRTNIVSALGVILSASYFSTNFQQIKLGSPCFRNLQVRSTFPLRRVKEVEARW